MALLELTFSCVTPDEFRCEEATAKLEECCPGFDTSQITCESDQSCRFERYNGSPTIRGRAATCLLERSCEDLRAANVCTNFEDPELRAGGPTSSRPVDKVGDYACAE